MNDLFADDDLAREMQGCGKSDLCTRGASDEISYWPPMIIIAVCTKVGAADFSDIFF